MRKHGFHDRIEPEDIHSLEGGVYAAELDQESSVLNAHALVEYAQCQAALLDEVLTEKAFPLIIGGDCSILVGNAVALKQRGDYALFYLDGHTDFVGPEISQTGAAGGMAAAIAAGYGHEKLTNIQGQRPYFREEYVWCVGNREYDEDYERPIRESDAHYVDLNALRETGIDQCIASFLEAVDPLDGFWLHVDVDVLDDEVMPAVDSRTPGGLSYGEFNRIMYLLLSSSKVAGVELTILDPDLDLTGKYTREFVENFCSVFNKAGKSREAG